MASSPLKIVSVVGTRPNFIKEFVMDRVCRARGVEKILVHTGQHYDSKMSDIFFRELRLPSPDYTHNLIKGSHAAETAAMLVFLEGVLQQEQPDVTLVYGDVNSTLAATLASVKLGIPVAHLEAGLRTSSRFNPEEINRRATDVLSVLNFAHIQEAYDALIREGYPSDSVFLTGDIHHDAVRMICEEQEIRPTSGEYILATVHRAENTADPRRLRNIFSALGSLDRRVIFPVHPRTEKAMRKAGLGDLFSDPGPIEFVEPQGYVGFLRLLAGCDMLFSDSGGARREACILGKRVVSLIELVWVPAMVEAGWERIAGADEAAILAAAADFPVPTKPQDIFGDGHAGERIVDILLQRFASCSRDERPAPSNVSPIKGRSRRAASGGSAKIAASR